MLPKSYVTNLRDFLSVCLNILHLTLFILILVLCLSLQPILNTSPILHLAFCLNFCFFKASALEKSKKCIAHRNIQPALPPFLHLPNLMSSFRESGLSRYLYPEIDENYTCFLGSQP